MRTDGASGWAMTAAGMRGVVNDALAIYFLDATLASAFVARWCGGYIKLRRPKAYSACATMRRSGRFRCRCTGCRECGYVAKTGQAGYKDRVEVRDLGSGGVHEIQTALAWRGDHGYRTAVGGERFEVVITHTGAQRYVLLYAAENATWGYCERRS